MTCSFSVGKSREREKVRTRGSLSLFDKPSVWVAVTLSLERFADNELIGETGESFWFVFMCCLFNLGGCATAVDVFVFDVTGRARVSYIHNLVLPNIT